MHMLPYLGGEGIATFHSSEAKVYATKTGRAAMTRRDGLGICRDEQGLAHEAFTRFAGNSPASAY
jgi:hypothetical protein